MSRRFERFEKKIQLAHRRSGDYLRRCCGAHMGSLDRRTVAAYGKGPISEDLCVQAYTEEANLYKDVNTALAHDTDEVLVHAEYIYHAKQQMKALWNEGNRFEGEAWRWVDLTEGDVAQFYPGKEFLWAPFVSTSKTPDSNFSGRNSAFQIDCDGEGLTYSVDISRLSAYPNEAEVLVYPYSGYVVRDVDRNFRFNGSQKTLIRLQVKDTLRVED